MCFLSDAYAGPIAVIGVAWAVAAVLITLIKKY